jgi:hypothetical protein
MGRGNKMSEIFICNYLDIDYWSQVEKELMYFSILIVSCCLLSIYSFLNFIFFLINKS